ncbi:alpha-glucosidase [Caldimonas tepidiphila]|uniref:alpha-glucosidase n=1 Tax=Caldimonas tepidiphila TaxID=2315841 RepID=UPI000E5BB397|nr:alpha-glucosidase [Caldimonas tepidiphila]
MKNDSSSEWWRGAVIYQIYPRSFMDSNGDGIGDLPGIEARLEHVARLGADAIWVSPFFRSPMKDFGYDVADYRDVDPIFGTLADFDRVIAKAHALGLKVMIDQVLSHTSDQHDWFRQSRASRTNEKADWYVWADPQPDGTPPNNWLSVFGGSAWQWDSRRRQYYLHSFLVSQPDLNFHKPEVQRQLLDEVRFWCERGVDGFRFDASNHQFHDAQLRSNPPAEAGGKVSTVQADNPYAMQRHLYDKSRPENLAFLERLRAVLDEYGAASIGEVGDEHAPPIMAAYTERGKRLHMAYSFSLLTRDGSAAHIREQVGGLEAELERTGGWGCWALSNHDVPRVATRWAPAGAPAPDLRQTRLLWAMLLSLRGSVCVYQGEELGLPEADVPYERLQDPYGMAFWPEFKGRDGCRTPMPWTAADPQGGFTLPGAEPWLPLSPEQLPLAVDAQEADAQSMLHFARAFLAWRRGRPALRTGGLRFVDAPEPLLLFERRPHAGDGRTLALAFNLGPAAQRLPLPARWRAGSVALLPDAPLAGARLAGDTMSLPPFGAFFGEFDEAAGPDTGASAPAAGA